ASVALVTEMQKSADKAKTMVPSKASKLPEAEKTKYMDTYKKDMDALNKELAALKEAVKAGENDKTKAELDKINQLKMSSHKELGVQMGPPGGGRGPGGPGSRRPMGPPPEGAPPQPPQATPQPSQP